MHDYTDFVFLLFGIMSAIYGLPFARKRVTILRHPWYILIQSILPLVLLVLFMLSGLPFMQERLHRGGFWTIMLFLYVSLAIVIVLRLIVDMKRKRHIVINIGMDTLRESISARYACTWVKASTVASQQGWLRRLFMSRRGYWVSFDDCEAYLRVVPYISANGYELYPCGICKTLNWSDFFDTLFKDLKTAQPQPAVGLGIYFLVLGLLFVWAALHKIQMDVCSSDTASWGVFCWLGRKPYVPVINP